VVKFASIAMVYFIFLFVPAMTAAVALSVFGGDVGG
jgi:hypothetical protein